MGGVRQACPPALPSLVLSSTPFQSPRLSSSEVTSDPWGSAGRTQDIGSSSDRSNGGSSRSDSSENDGSCGGDAGLSILPARIFTGASEQGVYSDSGCIVHIATAAVAAVATALTAPTRAATTVTTAITFTPLPFSATASRHPAPVPPPQLLLLPLLRRLPVDVPG